MSIFRSRCVQGVVLRPLPGQCRGHCQEFGFYSRASQRYTCNWEVLGQVSMMAVTLVTLSRALRGQQWARVKTGLGRGLLT